MTSPSENSSSQMRTILEELEQIAKTTRKDSTDTESRVVKAITMAGHVLDLVKSVVDPSDYSLLEKKFYLAIKNRNTSKFTNAYKSIKTK